MYKQKIVFVVGAGGSFDFQFPLGAKLADDISAMCDVVSDFNGDRISDTVLRNAVYAAASDGSYGSIGELINAARFTQGALSLSPSIDHYLAAHGHHQARVILGKLCIVQRILVSEKVSDLFVAPGLREEINFKSKHIKDSWIKQFFSLLTDGPTRADINNIFDNIAFVIFNYDRCVEHFLYHALPRFFDLTPDESAEILNKVSFLHPYGSIGRLPWQRPDANPAVSFGLTPSPEVHLQSAKRIKTISEREHEGTFLEELHRKMNEAGDVIFIGFAYHRDNVTLLGMQKNLNRRVLGTTKLMSKPNVERVLRRLRSVSSESRVTLFDGTGAELLTEHSMFWD